MVAPPPIIYPYIILRAPFPKYTEITNQSQKPNTTNLIRTYNLNTNAVKSIPNMESDTETNTLFPANNTPSLSLVSLFFCVLSPKIAPCKRAFNITRRVTCTTCTRINVRTRKLDEISFYRSKFHTLFLNHKI